ncbi:RAD52 DNA repair protein [Leptodontidium sp. MPI-SDFR-AT-0119]|nr:RAD52 DNA repair protein [Leptodontidium sp. MPI-SDFR-AT-0119]
MSTRKRKADDDGYDESMSISPQASPAFAPRPLARPSKKVRANEVTGRPLTLPRLLETLDAESLRSVLQTICERHPQIGSEVVSSAPRPSVDSTVDVLSKYQDNLREAFPFGGNAGSDYAYNRVKQQLNELIDALTDFTPHYLPPNENQTTVSLTYLDHATKVIHDLPEWDSQSHKHHKDNAYDEISRAWALVVSEASKRGGGFQLHSGGWDQRLSKHNEQSGGRMQVAVNALGSNLGWMGGMGSGSNDPGSIRNQLLNGTYGASSGNMPVRVGMWPGDQHNANGKVTLNPFEPITPQVSPYTVQEIAILQARLEKQLGPEYISSRTGPSNQKVHYLAAEKSIQLANEVFGFNGWSSQIMDIQVDFVDENPQSMKVSLGLSVIVRVTLRDGTFHEDIGYGHMENAKGKAAAFEKAKKEGTTDGLKRALKNFGNVLGNCLYDKDYVKNVTKMKVGSSKFEPDRLHRHSTFAPPPKKEPEIKQSEEKSQVVAGNTSLFRRYVPFCLFLGLYLQSPDFDEADFSVADPDSHPDEVVVPEPPAAASHNFNNSRRVLNQPSRNGPPSAPASPARLNKPSSNDSDTTSLPPQGQGFFSARAAQMLPEGTTTDGAPPPAIPAHLPVFNPHAESPSIRKTPGIDHKSSKPLTRDLKHVPGSSQAVGAPGAGAGAGPAGPRSNIMNPQFDNTRRIGAPGSPSPMMNRNSYKPPTMSKRPVDSRAPLHDLPPNGGLGSEAGGDLKRQRLNG